MKRLMTLVFLSALALLISGCEKKPQPPKKSAIDETLPKVEEIKYLSEMASIGFEWKANRDDRVEGIYVYRSKQDTNNAKLQRVATVEDKYGTHFVDTNLKPATTYFYRFSTFSAQKRESLPSEMVKVKTNPLLKSVSFIEAIAGLPHRVKLLWRPHSSQRVKSYLVERSDFSSDEWKQIAKVDGRLNAEYIDADLEENRMFQYRVRVQTYDGLVSSPSKVVEAGTKPLPHEIQKLRASNDLPKKIALQWEASQTPDFAYYKIYRALNPLLFYTYLAKTDKNSYEDLVNANGKSYYYHVTAVDEDGLESPRQDNAVMGSTLAAPKPVFITGSKYTDDSISLSWSTTDSRAVSFNVIKEYRLKSKKQREVITGVDEAFFKDNKVLPEVEYTYSVVAVDKYGLSSEPSDEVIIAIPKD